MHQLKRPAQVNGREKRFNPMQPRQEDEKRSGDPKIVFKRLTETLRFYKKGVKRMV
jgi:hypothetical protein